MCKYFLQKEKKGKGGGSADVMPKAQKEMQVDNGYMIFVYGYTLTLNPIKGFPYMKHPRLLTF